MHSPREETITLADGSKRTIRVNSCTHWAVLGPTDGYGKKNDHVFHHTAIHPIVDYHEKELRQKMNVKLSRVHTHTDNCSGQYKCCYVFHGIAAWAERHPGVTCVQSYAPVYEFKGVHDGVGKTVKSCMEKAESRLESEDEDFKGGRLCSGMSRKHAFSRTLEYCMLTLSIL
jgi:hypothetical protein